MIVDAHQHFWRLDRSDYDWLTPDLATLYRDFGPVDLDPLLDATGVDATIIVQAAATEAETRYCFELARQWPRASGVVGWIDFEAGNVADAVARLVADGGGLLRGLRPMIQDIADTGWVAKPELDAAFDAVIAHDLVFDALVKLPHLAALGERLDRFPDLRCVIDHGAKPPIAAREFDDWAAGMRMLSNRDNVVGLKLSGLLTEAGPGEGGEALRPYVDHLIDCFGPTRLIWGSDWPVLTLAGDYREWFDMAQALTARLGPDAQAAIFGGNAARVYRIGEAA